MFIYSITLMFHYNSAFSSKTWCRLSCITSLTVSNKISPKCILPVYNILSLLYLTTAAMKAYHVYTIHLHEVVPEKCTLLFTTLHITKLTTNSRANVTAPVIRVQNPIIKECIPSSSTYVNCRIWNIEFGFQYQNLYYRLYTNGLVKCILSCFNVPNSYCKERGHLFYNT